MRPAEALRYRWTPQEFLRAWESDVFDRRVELVDGEVWPVPIGSWHGDTTGRVVRALPNDRFVVTTASLPTASSIPDPDCWVRPSGASPAAAVSRRLSAWHPEDVLLVVEVSDETVEADLTVKAELYGAAGYATYWVVTREGVHEHTGPTALGYERVRLLGPADHVPVGYSATSLPVGAALLGA